MFISTVQFFLHISLIDLISINQFLANCPMLVWIELKVKVVGEDNSEIVKSFSTVSELISTYNVYNITGTFHFTIIFPISTCIQD